MAFKQQQGKRNGQAEKRNKIQRKPKRLQGHKQKTHLPRPEQHCNTVRSEGSLLIPGIFGSKVAQQLLKTCIQVQARRLVRFFLTEKGRPFSINSRDVQRTLKDALAKELAAQKADLILSKGAFVEKKDRLSPQERH